MVTTQLSQHGDRLTCGGVSVTMLTMENPDTCVFVVVDRGEIVYCGIDEEQANSWLEA